MKSGEEGATCQIAPFREHEQAELVSLCGEWDYGEPAKIRSLLCQAHFRLLVARARDPQHSWMGAVLIQDTGDTIEVLYIYVKQAWRRRGVAGELLAALRKKLAAQAAGGVLLLEVRRSNAAAIALYERIGMQYLVTRQRYYRDGEDALVYRLRVDHASV